MTGTVEIDRSGWASRLDALDTALARLGRSDLVGPLKKMRELFDATTRGQVDQQVGAQLLSQSISEIKSCLAGKRSVTDLPFVADIRALLEAPVVSSRTTSNEIRLTPDQEAWGASALAQFGDESLDVDSLMSALSVPTPKAVARSNDELGTLREPIVNMQAQSGADHRVLMKGELQPGLLSDIIQLFAQNAETGTLTVEGGARVATIFFAAGQIVDAICGEANGERGFFEAINITKGRFAYQRGVQSPEIRIFRSAQHLIMDTLRMLDEQA